MNNEDVPTYEELVRRLESAESRWKAIRSGEVRAIEGEHGLLAVRPARDVDREEHLKQVLLAIRNVNQLIVQETDPGRLIERACVNLTETLGYVHAWIAILDEAGEAVTRTARSGYPEHFGSLRERLERGDFPSCMRRAMACDRAVVIQDPACDCKDCPLADVYAGRAVLTFCLAYGRRLLGVLAVSVPPELVHEAQEQELFVEVANDLAFALQKIQDDRKRDAAETALRERVKELNCLYELGRIVEHEGATLESILRGATSLLPDALQFPASAVGRIQWRDRVFESDDFTACASRFSAELRLRSEVVGRVEVGYRAAHPPAFEGTFLKEECDLIHALAERLGRIIERKQAEDALRAERDLTERIMDTSPAGITVVDAAGRVRYANQRAEAILGLEAAAITERTYADPAWKITSFDGGPLAEEELPFARVRQTGKPVSGVEHAIEWPDGRRALLSINAAPINDASGAFDGMVAALEDITERRQTEERRRVREGELRWLFKSMINAFVIFESVFDEQERFVSYRFVYINDAYERITGVKNEEVRGKTVHEVWPGTEPGWIQNYGEVAVTGEPRSFEMFHAPTAKHYSCNVYRPWDTRDRFCVIFEDITERKRAEAERAGLEEQLRHAQKMDAIGRLAGGVAHDFNNMLQSILGYSDLLLARVDSDHAFFEHLQEIRNAALRSAELTGQLLAFARKQTIAPVVLDLNQAVEDALRMLRRLIGEDIDLGWQPGQHVGAVKMDAAQLNQIVTNLVINARDAIRGVGKITIETAQAEFDRDYCARHVGFVPGAYVMLAVSDDGVGMEPEAVSKVFEPFYTTKSRDHGTGLGLATVYGIVKQNEGFVTVYSEPGEGTTFRIYLRRETGAPARAVDTAPTVGSRAGTETMLVVEDETALLVLTRQMLERLGYTVLACPEPARAIQTARDHPGEIHLLITDVIMPQMNGRDLSARIEAIRPGLPCVFMSGYTANVIAHHGVLEEGVHFLQKPFSADELAAKVREVLDAGGGSSVDPGP
jgi:PAS domain S-box-containing protein